MTENRTLICPKCNKQGEFEVPRGWSDLVCSKCKQPFRCLLATVRGKRSRGDKKYGSREYSVRVLVGSNEDLIEYTNNDYYDFEMRSKDEVAFLYRQGSLFIVHNFTIGRHQVIKKSTSLLAIVMVAIIVVAILLALLAGSH